jgi:type IV pilus assembly protein PilW
MNTKRPAASQPHQQGFSLVELMIAITLSLVLTLGVIEIFSSSKQTNRTQSALGNLQENARFALDMLSYDIRMAGNIGCNRTAAVNNLATGDNLPNIGNGIQGYEYSGLPAVLITGSDKNPDSSEVVSTPNNTDVIVIRYATPDTLEVASTTTVTNTSSVTLTQTTSIDPGDPVIISDCTNADIFVAKTISPDKKTITLATGKAFNKSYASDAEVAPLKYVAYYIREGSNDINNLYRKVVNGVSGNLSINNAEPLLEGVENIQIRYGETLSDGKIRYVAAGTTGLDMNRVTSIRISLLFSTIDNNLASGTQSYWFDGSLVNLATTANSNKKLYRSFTTTIKLRNQGIGL